MAEYQMDARCKRCNHTYGIHTESDRGRCNDVDRFGDRCNCTNFIPKTEKKMVMDEAQLRGKLYELGTVDIRSVLRLLNKQKKVVAGTELAAMRHEAAFRLITSNFNGEEIEAAYLAVTTKSPEVADPPVITEERTPPIEPEREIPPAPTPPKTRAQILEELLKGGELDEKKVRVIVHDELDTTVNALARDNIDHDRRIRGQSERIDKVIAQVDTLDGRFQDVEGTNRRLVNAFNELGAKVVELNEKVSKSQVTNLVISFPDDSTKDIGITHRLTPKLIKYLSTGVACYLPGPAGSGKSTAAEQAAKALGIKFYPLSFSSQTTETKLLGYMDAAGQYHGTQFREAYENGGLVLFDEIDAGNPNVIAVLNAALSGVWCSFADKVITRHKDFRCVAAANTWGTGRTIQYVGRNALDAATLNRFVFIEWDYDEALETAVAGLPDWSTYVQACRAEIRRRGINYLITPRASIYGAQLLRAGCKIEDVCNDVLFPNLDPDNRRTMPPAPVISV